MNKPMIAAVAFLLGVAAAGLVFLRAGRDTDLSMMSAEDAAARQYYCPMHPTMVSDRPGDCPICQMRMVPVTSDADDARQSASGGSAVQSGKKIIYRSTMNPSEVSNRPGKDSMGMEMVPVEVEETTGARPGIEGRATVKIPPLQQQLIGVRTAPVERQPLIRTIRTVGRVTYDETRLHHVHTKVSGWIERMHANTTGELVKKGQPLLTIYSPELLASQQEYLLALRARARLSGSTLPGIGQSGEDLVASARRRLRLFDMTADQIQALEKSGEPSRTTALFAPSTGYIVMRNVLHGQKIDPSTTVLDIADLSRVWVLADIYEYELPFVRLGQKATVTLSYLPGRLFEGRVSLIYPFLTEATRTVKVRLEFPNPDLALKPDMFAEVELRSDLGLKLIVPSSAIIRTGERDIVFVDRGEGYFEPRELKLGVKLSDAFEVLEGLSEGERILISGNFLVDSESKLKAALSATGPTRPAAGSSGAPSSRTAPRQMAPAHVH